MSLPKDQAWFPAKTYGYGWSLPMRWQGWLAMGGYTVAMLMGGLAFAPTHPVWFLAYAVGATGCLVALCYWKGEAAKWRWGK